MNFSPLRYPGGKSKLYDCVESIISGGNNTVDTYVEPFAGGASIALSLLLNGKVENIIINDLNKGIYSFWKSICTDTDKFLKLLDKTPIDLENYFIQKKNISNFKKIFIRIWFFNFLSKSY